MLHQIFGAVSLTTKEGCPTEILGVLQTFRVLIYEQEVEGAEARNSSLEIHDDGIGWLVWGSNWTHPVAESSVVAESAQ